MWDTQIIYENARWYSVSSALVLILDRSKQTSRMQSFTSSHQHSSNASSENRMIQMATHLTHLQPNPDPTTVHLPLNPTTVAMSLYTDPAYQMSHLHSTCRHPDPLNTTNHHLPLPPPPPSLSASHQDRIHHTRPINQSTVLWIIQIIALRAYPCTLTSKCMSMTPHSPHPILHHIMHPFPLESLPAPTDLITMMTRSWKESSTHSADLSPIAQTGQIIGLLEVLRPITSPQTPFFLVIKGKSSKSGSEKLGFGSSGKI